jgi:flagellar protein FlgJ
MWRWNLHATMAALSVTALVLGSAWKESSNSPPVVSAAVDSPRDEPTVFGVESPAPPSLADQVAAALAEAADGDPRPLVERITTYRVQAGDTLNKLAARFAVSADTLQWANNLRDPNRLLPGQELTLLPVNGVLHTARDGETVADVAARYGSTPVRLIVANGLAEPYALRGGQRLLVPDGQPQAAAPDARKGEWPAAGTGDRNKRQFIEASAAPAQESQRRTHVPASVIIAQAIHESYWGTSNLARNANNFFGIKARNGEGSAGVYWMDAWEVINGENVVVPEPFRAYTTPDDSFVDHGLFFIRNSRYHPAFAYTDDPRGFARAIAEAGYATDPGYAPKLIGIMDQYNLYQYDLPITGEQAPTRS